jgi:oxygen-independent coproporphyrinogen-3 oxidase
MSSIYIHIPFCKRKCIYCDFYSIEKLELIPVFIKALRKEIILFSEKNFLSNVETVYFGGGTPSIIPDKYIDEILNIIHKSFTIKKNAEITIEVNPGTVSRTVLETYCKIGINRISIGVQSFIQRELDFLQRIHTTEEAEKTIVSARESGFENISIDLIYAIPSGTFEDWKKNLKKTIEYNPDHISAYSLIYENGTELYNWKFNNKIVPVSEETEAEMYDYTMNFLEDNKYYHYEVSNYAKPGYECRHNKNYWNHSEYLGFGPSSHSYINRTRWWNFKDLNEYVSILNNNCLPIEGKEDIDDHTLLEEKVYLGLRSEGVNLGELKNQFNVDFYEKNKNIIDDLVKNGYIEMKNSGISLTKKGFLVCDEICKRLNF